MMSHDSLTIIMHFEFPLQSRKLQNFILGTSMQHYENPQ